MRWVHEVLVRLSRLAPVPTPLPLLDGHSFRRIGDAIWETLSRLPGSVVGDRALPPLAELGAFLASYHEASTAIHVPERPSRTPVAELGAVLDLSHAPPTTEREGTAQRLRALIDRLNTDLRTLGHSELPRCVLHGDPTSFNIVATGDPPRPCGLIDFDLAYHDPPAADIGFAMWRSGRPAPGAPQIDVDRLREFVVGYCTVRPLIDVERAAIPLYLRARGLQMLVKRARLGINDNGPLEQVRWIAAHHDELRRAVEEPSSSD